MIVPGVRTSEHPLDGSDAVRHFLRAEAQDFGPGLHLFPFAILEEDELKRYPLKRLVPLSQDSD